MHRTRVLLLFGGESAEHEVSIASARNVFAALGDTKYDIYLCYITRDGHWRLIEEIEALDGSHHALLPVLGGKHFITEPGGKSVVPDVVMPVLHGPNGEDGSMQGLAQLLHIPIVGCGVVGGAVCMDKDIAKRLMRAAGLPVVESFVYRKGEPVPRFSKLTLQLGNPLFVKPANLGSSVGVAKVYDERQFEKAIADALQHDNKVLIEQAVPGAREIECSVMGNADVQVSGLGEVKPNSEFYSYKAKYDPESKAELVIPADLPEDLTKQIQTMAATAYKTLECRGLARVDFFVAGDNTVYVNELNTFPGFTNISMYPKLWRAAGLHYGALVDKLIELALED